MGEYESAVALATRLINRKGASIKLRTVADGAPTSPNKPWEVPSQSRRDFDWHAVFLDYSVKEIDGTTVLQGDQHCFAVPDNVSDAVEPTSKARIVRGTQVWTIVKVTPLNPGGVVIYYDIQVRQ